MVDRLFKSLKVFRIFGTDVKLHWSWLILFFLIIDFSAPIGDMIVKAASVFMIFTFVLVHEFGHIFAGRKYGVNTKTVVLSLLGGIAYMDGELADLKPKQSLWVTFAGPLTNLVMFVLLIPVLIYAFQDFPLNDPEAIKNMTGGQYLALVGILVNVMMFIFNLLPIYPMDGGRLLRSTLELFNVKHSLVISIIITMVFCLLLLGFSIWAGSWSGGIISIVFFLMAISEMRDRKNDIDMSELDGDTREKFKMALAKFKTKEQKLLFLDGIVARTEEDSRDDEILINYLKKHADEFRKDIEGAGDNG